MAEPERILGPKLSTVLVMALLSEERIDDSLIQYVISPLLYSVHQFCFFVTRMPSSIDIGRYEKAPMLEGTWHPDNPSSSSSDEGGNAVPMLKGSKQKKAGLKPWPEHPVKWIRSPWMFLIDLFLIILVLIFASREPRSAHLDFAGDITGFVPKFSQQIVTFRAYPEFISNHSSEESLKEAREHWMDLLPRELPHIFLFRESSPL